jgi:photosystem II stability/assembly factor-like uncharacterized protein
MKRAGTIILLACLFLGCRKNTVSNPSVQSLPDTLGTGWVKIPAFTNLQFNDIFFINRTGFTMSYTFILKSEDGGDNWKKLDPKIINLLNMGMGSESNAIFVCFPNKIMSTHDGGNNFDTVSLADSYLMDVFYVSPEVAYAAGNFIWKTLDGGRTWAKLFEFTVQEGYKSLYFLDPLHGWVVREDGVYKTADGGINWQRLSTSPYFDFRGASCLAFENTSAGFLSDNNYIARTVNGNTWDTVLHVTHFYHDIAFVSLTTGYVTDDSHIYKTTDGGLTWNKDVSLGSGSLVELHFTDANHGWACGSKGCLLKYTL